MDVSMAMIGKLCRQFDIDEWLFMVKLAGSHDAAFVLRKIIRWNESSTVQERGGEFYKTHAEMSEETGGLSPYRIRKAQTLIKKYVHIDKRRYKGRDWTWYRVDVVALLQRIGKVLESMTGKIFDLINDVIGREPVRNLRRSGLKNLSRQTLTISSKDQSDDDVIDLPIAFKKFAFKGLRDDVRLMREIERLGTDKALEVLERCVKFGGKRWSYVWTSLAEETSQTSPPTPLHYGEGSMNHRGTEAQSGLAGLVAEVVNRGDVVIDAQSEALPEVTGGAVDQPVGAWGSLREAWALVMSQLRLRFDQMTFDTWLSDMRVVDFADNMLVVAVANEYAEERINTRLHRDIRRVISDVINHPVELRAVANWGA